VWDEFLGWAETADDSDAAEFDVADLGAPTPAPAQVFAIGLNYTAHAAESNFAVPDTFPPTFTKFRTALSGPVTTVAIPTGGNVDWEIELVAVIGRRAEKVAAADAWPYVAGLTAGQDISERIIQLSGQAPQFSLGKSYPGFAPIGPWVVTVDEFTDPDDIDLQCAVDGETVQHGRTKDFVFGVPRADRRIVPGSPRYCRATSFSAALPPGSVKAAPRKGSSRPGRNSLAGSRASASSASSS